jgi:hypothetical protein
LGATRPFTSVRGIALEVRFVADKAPEQQAARMRRDQPVEHGAPARPHGSIDGRLRCNRPLRQIG